MKQYILAVNLGHMRNFIPGIMTVFQSYAMKVQSFRTYTVENNFFFLLCKQIKLSIFPLYTDFQSHLKACYYSIRDRIAFQISQLYTLQFVSSLGYKTLVSEYLIVPQCSIFNKALPTVKSTTTEFEKHKIHQLFNQSNV